MRIDEWENRVKAAKAKKQRGAKCECGCVVGREYFNKFGWGACPVCGAKVLKPRDNFKDKLLTAMKEDK